MASGGRSADFKALLQWYARERLYRHLQEECSRLIAKRGNESFIVFWRAFGAGMEGNTAEAIRELNDLRQKRDAELPALTALLYFHQLQTRIDMDEVSMIRGSLSKAERIANDNAVLMTASFSWHVGDHATAKRLLTRAMPEPGASSQLTHDQLRASTLFAWVEMTSPGGLERVHEAFLRDPSTDDLDALMASATWLQKTNQFSLALDKLNRAIALHAWFTPALLEKAKIMLASRDWDQAIDVTQRVLAVDEENIEALRTMATCTATRQANTPDLVEQLTLLQAALDRREPSNALLYFTNSQLFARLSGRKRAILRITRSLLDHALNIDPNSSAFHAELGLQQAMSGDLERAMDSFRRASKLDETNLTALQGMIHCQILVGEYSDAEQQVEFFKAIQDSVEPTPFVAFLEALLAWRAHHDAAAHLRLLDVAIEGHLRRPTVLGGVVDLVRFNPDFVMEVAKEYLRQHSPNGAPGAPSSASVPVAVQRGLSVLAKVVFHVPGLVEAHLVTAQARASIQQHEHAQSSLATCLELEPSNSDAHLLRAQVALAQGNHRLANQSIEQALSYSFQVRDSPLYHLVRAQVLSEQGDLDQALAQLEEAMQLPGVRSAQRGRGGRGRSRDSPAVVVKVDQVATEEQRAAIFIETVRVLGKLNRLSEAQALANEARETFRGLPSEVQVVVADSELAIRRNDFESAIRMLSQVPEESAGYARAQMVKANIYLTHRHDRQGYTQCYRDLVRLDHSPSTLVMLGDALMRIQAPEAAVREYERALEIDRQDTMLAAKIGRALVSTHDYRKATNYYTNALKNMPNNTALRHDLAKLLSKLRRHDQAVQCLQGLVEAPLDLSDPSSSYDRVETLVLLADVYKEALREPERRESLLSAKHTQNQLLDRLRTQMESPEDLERQKGIQAAICLKLAESHEADKNDEAAIQCYREALRTHSTDEKCMLALCRLHLRRSDFESCKAQCEQLTRLNPDNEEANILVADMLFHQDDDEAATVQYRRVLRKRPNNFVALRKMMELLKRAGKLDEAPELFRLAERANPRAFSQPGFQFCKGLFHRYINDVHEAVKYFNFCRRDGVWGKDALTAMIEIYLNPANENMWDPESAASDGHAEAVRIAETLLLELRAMQPAPLPLGFRVLEVYAVMGKHMVEVANGGAAAAEGGSGSLDLAEQRFIEILEQDREYVPAMLGLSTVFLLEKAQNKARNMLKRITKMKHSHDLSNEFERSYLALADIYIQKSKYDLALELCKRCLHYNKSCTKAWEFMGVIMEKEQAYKDAADNYEKAWACSSESSAPVGYRLAFNYLKAKKYVEAIDVCHKVLRQFPDYPAIREDILEKAYSSLRT